MGSAATAEPYIGRYFSQDYVRRKILRQTDEEIIEQDKIMEKEIADGIIPDPLAPVDPETGAPLGEVGAAGDPVMEPDLEGEVVSTSGKKELPKGGEI